jgi:hypothetical protein
MNDPLQFRPPEGGRVCEVDGLVIYDLPLFDPTDGSFVRPGLTCAYDGDILLTLERLWEGYLGSFDHEPAMIVVPKHGWDLAFSTYPGHLRLVTGDAVAPRSRNAYRGVPVLPFSVPPSVVAYGPVSIGGIPVRPRRQGT